MNSNVIWHDTECGAYAADLEAWERLASESEGPILELGCGTGRVALHLARRGHEVWAVDLDAELIAALGERAAADGLPVHTERADVRQLDLGREFGLVIAAMQFIQMIGAEPERVDALRRVAAHLQPGGRLAAAILDGLPRDLWDAPAPLPDVREVDGRVYSSLPADLIADGQRLELRRLRQEISVDGTMAETEHAESLWLLDADSLERETAAAGLEARNRIQVPPMNGYIGSVIVVAEWVR
ncbi:MAG: class I SAM-dependent methyltransferase [Actinobacteria bacterium]|jgi:SAM-dependent methyltransferase|nr:MAG: class I SAM-dependent methyltransferase [Actinomycetota bacterium]